MLNRARLLVFLFGLAFLSGCSPYIYDIHYVPHPAIAEIHAATTQPSQGAPPPVTAYATIVGIRRAHDGLPLSVELRLRLDNLGLAAVSFDPRTLDLSNGELLRFPPPLVQTPQAYSLAPGQPLMVHAEFPFPPGVFYDSPGMESLQLRWQVEIDGHIIPQVADFHRVNRYYYDPYWDYPYPYAYPYYGYPYVGIGGTFIIRR